MRWLGRLAAFLFLVACLGGGAALWAVKAIEAPGPLGADRILVIERGSSLTEIAEQLERNGIISHALLFVGAAKVRGIGRALRAGEYRFPAGISIVGAIALLQSGQTFVRSVTIPEGLTVPQVLAILESESALSGVIGMKPPEGSLLPDTYHISLGDSRESLVERMRNAMTTVLADAWAEREPGVPLETPEDALILASIVEKETAVPDERPRVAGVFLNRLADGMRLQSDPTVVYALSDGTGDLGRPLTRADWQVESPFNTYQVTGLPPSPIANPGRDSIRAVLAPEEHKYYYFVADGTGGHAFARTLAEHNRNVAAWRRVQRERPQ